MCYVTENSPYFPKRDKLHENYKNKKNSKYIINIDSILMGKITLTVNKEVLANIKYLK